MALMVCCACTGGAGLPLLALSVGLDPPLEPPKLLQRHHAVDDLEHPPGQPGGPADLTSQRSSSELVVSCYGFALRPW